MDVFFMTTSREDARAFIDDCADWIRWLTPLIGALIEGDVEVHESAEHRNSADDWFEDDDGQRILAFRIDFPSGFSIYGLPSRPARLRGKQGYAICDEAAQQDIEAWRAAAGGLLIWGGRLAYISTHLGSDNEFYKLVEEAKLTGSASVHSISIYDALADGLYRRICRTRLRKAWTKEGELEWLENLRLFYGERFPEECEMIVSRSGTTVYARAEIDRCCILGPAECTILEIRGGESPRLWIDTELREVTSGTWDPEVKDAELFEEKALVLKGWLDAHLAPVLERIKSEGLPVFAGLDYGRTQNLSAWAFAFKRRDARRRLCLYIELEKMAWPLQDYIADYIWEGLLNLAGGCGDAQGGGGNSAERAAAKTSGKIKPVKINTGWHEKHFPLLGKRISAQATQLPHHFGPLVEDLASVQRGTNGKIGAPERKTKGERKQKRHADGAFALALLEQSIDEEPPPPLEENVIKFRPRARGRRKNRR